MGARLAGKCSLAGYAVEVTTLCLPGRLAYRLGSFDTKFAAVSATR